MVKWSYCRIKCGFDMKYKFSLDKGHFITGDILIKDIKTKVYAGRIKDRDLLNRSSSGGAFIAISNYFLNNGDAVVCAIYNYKKHETEFKIIIDKKARDSAIGSKYMQSKPGQVFKEAKEWLYNYPQKKLLFVGMGCQTDGFRKFTEINKLHERVWIVDIVCHGSPSSKLWQEYANALEKKRGKITYLSFKDKRNGWKFPTAYVIANGKEYLIKDYVKVFYSGNALRPSCYNCPYATTERKTDLTMGDFWHIEETIPDFYDEEGNSLFLIHTERGEKLFDTIAEKLEYRLSDTKECWQANLERPTKKPKQRNIFWNDYQKKEINFIMRKYGTIALKTKVKNKISKLISRGGLALKTNQPNYTIAFERRLA